MLQRGAQSNRETSCTSSRGKKRNRKAGALQARSVDQNLSVKASSSTIQDQVAQVEEHRQILEGGRYGAELKALFENLLGKKVEAEQTKGNSKATDAGAHIESALASLTVRDSEPPIKALESSIWQGSRKGRQLICLGIGSPCNSRAASFQLAFLLALRKHLAEAGTTMCYDPVFTTEDRLLLEKLNIVVMTSSQASATLHEATQAPTILFMPHCPRSMHDAVLRANWSKEGLDNLLLCCNELKLYAENSSDTELARNAPSIHRILPYLASHPLPSDFPTSPDHLHNTCFQFFLEAAATARSQPESSPSEAGFKVVESIRAKKNRPGRKRVEEVPARTQLSDPDFFRVAPPPGIADPEMVP